MLTCGHEEIYNAEYDAHYCGICNIWVDVQCEDPQCCYCIDRPETPLADKDLDTKEVLDRR